MADADSVDQKIREALAAFGSKQSSLEEFEHSVSEVMNSAGKNRALAETTLREAAAAGTVPRETVIRFGIDPVGHDNEGQSAGNRRDPAFEEAGADGELKIGRLLNERYRIERKIGSGGMGVVYYAVDIKSRGESYAIKVLKAEIRSHPAALELLEEEASKLRKMRHENIVGVYSLNFDGPITYILMEYLEGKTLDNLLDEEFGRGIPFSRAWPWIEDIGAGLAFAHDRSVIHSDLKPSNVFVTTSGRAKLLDFGIARAARGRVDRVDPGALGALTEAYASPEMFDNLAPDQRDDIYSLACVVYEMLSGRHPFGGQSAAQASRDHRQPKPIAAITTLQNEALARAVTFDRADRTGTVEEFVAGLKVRAPEKDSQQPPFNWVWIGVAIAGLVAVVLAVWIVPQWMVPPKPAPREGSANAPANASAESLGRLEILAQAARRVGADPEQPAWREWQTQVSEAQRALAAGDGSAVQKLGNAESSLRTVVSSGLRVMQVGSTPQEVGETLQRCQASGTAAIECKEALEGEQARIVHFKPFTIDEKEVSNRQFEEFVAMTGYKTQAERGQPILDYVGNKGVVERPGQSWRTLRDTGARAGADPGELPVRGIEFQAAAKYCDWRKKRLPTSEEWEFVARGVERHTFPWGDEWPTGEARNPATLLPVDQQPATSPWGNRGMGGALWEWVEGGSGQSAMLRGASWRENAIWHQRLAMLRMEPPLSAFADVGFRCAQTVAEWPNAHL